MDSFNIIIEQLNTDGYKRVTEKTSQMTKAIVLLEDKNVRKEIIQNRWIDNLLKICSISVKELSQNRKLHGQGKTSFKKDTIPLLKKAMELQFDGSTPAPEECDIKTIYELIIKCFLDAYTVWFNTDMATFLNITSIISNTFQNLPAKNVSSEKLKRIWKICITQLELSLTRERSTERTKLTELLCVLTEKLSETQMHFSVFEVIKDWSRIAGKFNWDTKDPVRTCLLDGILSLFSSYAYSHRDILFQSFSDIAENLRPNVNLFTQSEKERDRRSLQKYSPCFQNSAHKFFEWLFMTGFPSCQLNVFYSEKADYLFDNLLQQFFAQITEQKDKSNVQLASSSRSVKISTERLPLLARLFTLHYQKLTIELRKQHNCGLTITTPVKSPMAKRPRNSTALSPSERMLLLLDLTFFPHLQIVHKLLESWHKQMGVEFMELLAQRICLKFANSVLIKDADRLILFVRVTTLLVREKSFGRDLLTVWNWALPLLHNQAAHKSICILFITLITTGRDQLKLSDDFIFNVLASNMSRLTNFHNETLRLLLHLVTRFEFDESFIFRAELTDTSNMSLIQSPNKLLNQTPSGLHRKRPRLSSGSISNDFWSSPKNSTEHENGIGKTEDSENKAPNLVDREWCFRKQLINCVVHLSEPDADLSELLVRLFSYHPYFGQALDYDENEHRLTDKSSEVTRCESFLSDLYRINSLDSERPSEKIFQNAKHYQLHEFIDCLINYYASNVNSLLRIETGELVEKKFQLWRTTTTLKSLLLDLEHQTCAVTDRLNELLMQLNSYMIGLLESPPKELGSSKLYRLMTIGKHWKESSPELRALVEKKALDDRSTVLFQQIIYWNTKFFQMNPFFIKDTMQGLTNMRDSRADELVLGILETLTLDDMIIVLKGYGRNLSSFTIFKIAEELISEIDDGQDSLGIAYDARSNASSRLSANEQQDENIEPLFSQNRASLNTSGNGKIDGFLSQSRREPDLAKLLLKEQAANNLLLHLDLRNFSCSEVNKITAGQLNRVCSFVFKNASPRLLSVRFERLLYRDWIDLFPVDLNRIQTDPLLSHFEAIEAFISKHFPEQKSIERCRFLSQCLEQPSFREIQPQIILHFLTSCAKSEHLERLCPHLDQLLECHSPILSFLVRALSTRFSELKLPNKCNTLISSMLAKVNTLAAFIEDKTVPFGREHLPQLFFLPRSLLRSIVTRFEFAQSWLSFFQDPINYFQSFSIFRSHLFGLQNGQLSTHISVDQSVTVLRALPVLFWNLHWDSLPYAVDLCRDLYQIATTLFSRATVHCPEWELIDLLISWLSFSAKLSQIKSIGHFVLPLILRIVDTFIGKLHNWYNVLVHWASSDQSSTEFRKLVEKYCRVLYQFDQLAIEGPDTGARPDLAFFQSMMIPYNSEGIGSEVASIHLSGLEVFEDSEVPLLCGFWRFLCTSGTIASNQDDEAALYLLFSYFSTHQNLRFEIAPLLALFPSDRVRKARLEFVKKRVSESGKVGDSASLRAYLLGTSRRLLFSFCTFHPPHVTTALYSIFHRFVANLSNSNFLCPQNLFESDSLKINSVQISAWAAGLISLLLQDESLRKMVSLDTDQLLPIVQQFPVEGSLLLAKLANSVPENYFCGDGSIESLASNSRTFIAEITRRCQQLLQSSDKGKFSEKALYLLSSLIFIALKFGTLLGQFDLLVFVQCSLRAELFTEAYFFLKFYIDHLTSTEQPNSRVLFHLTATDDAHFAESFSGQKNQLLQLLAQIHIGTRDSVSLSALPLQSRIDDPSRILLAESKCDWGVLSGLYAAQGMSGQAADALYLLGNTKAHGSTETYYSSFLKLADWRQLDTQQLPAPDQTQRETGGPLTVSFPKRAETRSGVLFSLLKLVNDGKCPDLDSVVEMFWKNELEEDFLISGDRLDLFGDLLFLRQQISEQSSMQHSALDFTPTDSFRLRQAIRISSFATSQRNPMLLCSWQLAKANAKQRASLPDQGLLQAVLQRSKELRKLHAYQPALKLLDNAEQTIFRHNCVGLLPHIQLERSKVLIASGDNQMAEYFLKNLCSRSNQNSKNSLTIKVHLLLSKITPQLSGRDEQTFEHLKKACSLSDRKQQSTENSLVESSRCFMRLAAFSEKKFHALRDFTETKTFTLKQEAFTQWQKELVTMRGGRTLEDTKARERTTKEMACEREDIDRILTQREQWLHETSKVYLRILQTTDKAAIPETFTCHGTETVIHRFTALLIQNAENKKLIDSVKDDIDKLPSHIWLPVFNVLSSYLFSEGLPLAELVEKIAFRVIPEHPFHTLNHLLFYLDPKTHDDSTSASTKRRMTASSMVQKLMKNATNKELRAIIGNLKNAHEIYQEFGHSNISQFTLTDKQNEGRDVYKLPANLRILKNKFQQVLKAVPIPTVTQKVAMSGNYSHRDLITVSSVNPTCEKADGISAPKVLSVLGSDGKYYKLIFKNEDIRQDALIQQLFTLTNLLIENHSAKQSVSLDIPFAPLRTYNVLPVDVNLGIIEHALGTISICNYLAGPDKESGAHKKYCPEEITVQEARQLMGIMMANGKSNTWLGKFQDLCTKISPVFRHFFYERFLQPQFFHRRVSAYTRSLAQWSIVCYVVGLGDRHLNNILIDLNSAELIHIDLGMIFEYSQRLLPMPERVPFRLTREMVDPFLVDGPNGKFKKIAVDTLQLMRENSQVLIGISSLLLHDPISTFAKIRDNTDGRNLFAETAISRLKEKLAGRDLTFVEMDVEQQVAQLIRNARDPDNLSRMFSGWLPFL